jgi:drug/metabolite transporter (DMT)-like permease
MNPLWLPLALVAGFLQIVRNAAQRGLSDTAGPWGATLVRFLFGLPFALIFLGGVYVIAPPVAPRFDLDIGLILALGASAQVCATAALMASMRASSFALGSTFQHMSLPLAALFGGVFLGDHLGAVAWTGIGLASLGLLVASWPKGGFVAGVKAGPGAFKAGLLGLASGACFAVSANCYRQCGMAIDPTSPFFSSSLTLVLAQGLQSVGLGAIFKGHNGRRAQLAHSRTGGGSGLCMLVCGFDLSPRGLGSRR